MKLLKLLCLFCVLVSINGLSLKKLKKKFNKQKSKEMRLMRQKGQWMNKYEEWLYNGDVLYKQKHKLLCEDDNDKCYKKVKLNISSTYIND